MTWLLEPLCTCEYYWNSPTRVAHQTIQWAFWALVVYPDLIGWRRGWPRWAAVWVGFFLVVVAENLIELSPSGVFPGIISVPAWLLLVALALLWQARRDALKGFLTVLPIVPMLFWLFSMDGIIGNEGPYYILIGILMAVGVGTVVRIGTMKVALGLLLPLILLISLGISYGNVYHSNASAAQGTEYLADTRRHSYGDAVPGNLYLPVVGIFPGQGDPAKNDLRLSNFGYNSRHKHPNSLTGNKRCQAAQRAGRQVKARRQTSRVRRP